MSIEHLNKALKIQGLKPTEKFILVILANYSDEQGSCYPSYGHIAEMIGLQTNKSVKIAIKKFVTLGLLRIEHRYLDNGGYTSNRYHLTLGGVAEDHRVVVEPSHGSHKTTNTKDYTKEEYIDQFNKFWSIYPRKIGKKKSYKIFTKYDEKHYKKILYGTHRFAEQSKQTEDKFIPHPSTWLNGERWMDYFETDESGCVTGVKKVSKINNLAG